MSECDVSVNVFAQESVKALWWEVVVENRKVGCGRSGFVSGR